MLKKMEIVEVEMVVGGFLNPDRLDYFIAVGEKVIHEVPEAVHEIIFRGPSETPTVNWMLREHGIHPGGTTATTGSTPPGTPY